MDMYWRDGGREKSYQLAIRSPDGIVVLAQLLRCKEEDTADGDFKVLREGDPVGSRVGVGVCVIFFAYY